MPPIQQSQTQIEEAVRLMRAFRRIRDARVRQALVMIAERLARQSATSRTRPRGEPRIRRRQ